MRPLSISIPIKKITAPTGGKNIAITPPTITKIRPRISNHLIQKHLKHYKKKNGLSSEIFKKFEADFGMILDKWSICVIISVGGVKFYAENVICSDDVVNFDEFGGCGDD